MQGDSQETGLIGRPKRSSTTDSFETELASKAVPVTPGVHLSGQSAYFEETPGVQDEPLAVDDDVSLGPSWNANTYSAPKENDPNKTGSTVTPAEVVDGSKSPEEMLHRLSLAPNSDTKRELTEIDPRAAHPSLDLSGSIISATFVVPYSIGYAPDQEWVCWHQLILALTLTRL
jgi:trehalose 6-phosphate synthase/phosphatase